MPLKHARITGNQSAEFPSYIFQTFKEVSLSFGFECTTHNWWKAVRVIKYRYTRIYIRHGPSSHICSQGTSKGSYNETCPSNLERREQLNSFDLNYPALIPGSKVRQEQRPMAPETHSSAPAQIGQVNQTITAWSQRTVSDLILPYQKSTESYSFVLKKKKKQTKNK